MMEPILRNIRAIGLDTKEDPVIGSQKRASVLIPLTLDGSVVLTKRPDTLRSHAGEVCFPGGKQDEEDEMDDIRTALRETKEEVGLTQIRPLARFPALESYYGLCVTPVVGLVEESVDTDTLDVSENEVEDVFLVPLSFFADDNNLSGPVESIAWRGGTFDMRTYHFTYRERTFTIWGLTAHIAHQVASTATYNGKGQLFRYDESRSVWRKRYFEIEGFNVLHEYESEQHVKKSASKKNRIHLRDLEISVEDYSQSSSRFYFQIVALGGRVCWKLAAEKETERQQWIAVLRACGQST